MRININVNFFIMITYIKSIKLELKAKKKLRKKKIKKRLKLREKNSVITRQKVTKSIGTTTRETTSTYDT